MAARARDSLDRVVNVVFPKNPSLSAAAAAAEEKEVSGERAIHLDRRPSLFGASFLFSFAICSHG